VNEKIPIIYYPLKVG